MSSLFFKALAFNIDSHRSNPANLIMGTLGMFLNNVIVLWALWVMLFHGKPQNESLFPYYMALNAMILLAWGGVTFCLGGLRALGEYIDEGTLEPMLSTPRHPLFLVAVSRSSPVALGDVAQGVLTIIALFWIASPDFALRTLAMTSLSIVGVIAVFIIAGSLSFFLNRGANVGQLLVETSLSFSFYPSGKVFTDRMRVLLYVIPAAGMTFLPMEAVELPSWRNILFATMASFGFLGLGLMLFKHGLKNYRTANYVGARSG